MTTERVLPAVSLPLPARPGAPGVPHVTTRTADPRPAHGNRAVAGTRNQPLLTAQARAGMLVGATAAVYAISLTAVAGLQSSADAELAARRQPYLDEIVASRAANDLLEARVRDADAATRALAVTSADTLDDVAEFQARLDALTSLVAEVEGTAAALPTRIKLPSVSTRGPIAASRSGSGSRPSTTTNTGGSGG